MVVVKKSGAYTLIEIVIVLGIIMALAAFIVPRIMKYLGQAKVSQTKQVMSHIEENLMLYYSHIGRYPATREGLDALVIPPVPRGNWEGPYLDEIPMDSWQQPFEYRSYRDIVSKEKYKYYEIFSRGDPVQDREIVTGK